jgi:hypothetical protein
MLAFEIDLECNWDEPTGPLTARAIARDDLRDAWFKSALVVIGELIQVFNGDGVVPNRPPYGEAAVMSVMAETAETADGWLEKTEAGREQAEPGDWRSTPSRGLVPLLRNTCLY